jgi:hypothetical protein
VPLSIFFFGIFFFGQQQLQMAEVWLLLATEMVWWVIFALLMLVGRPVWTMLSVFVHR